MPHAKEIQVCGCSPPLPCFVYLLTLGLCPTFMIRVFGDLRLGKQKAVPHNFQVDTVVCYAKEDNTPGYAFSVAGKAARTSIYVRYWRPRPENFQEEGRVALEWAPEPNAALQ